MNARPSRLIALSGALAIGIALGWTIGSRSWTVSGSPLQETALRGVAASAPELRSAGGTGLPRASAGVATRQSGETTPVDDDRRMTPFVRAVQQILPSVVSISAFRRERGGARSLLDLFGPGRERVVEGLGSGFAVDDDGFILTNHHVVQNADSVIVLDTDGRTYAATIIGQDELTDVAVLRIAAGQLPAAPLGRSSDLMVGEPVIAIGNPLGSLVANSEASVTSGVISGVGRDIRSTGPREVLYADMVQTDASINPGNSGGPLVNINGEVIGVNSSIFSTSGGSQGLGFAIPIERALRVAEELRDFGRIRRPWVGVDLATVPSDSVLSIAGVRRVAPGSPAARAGLGEGDVVLLLDDRVIRGALDWEIALLDAGVNSEIVVRYRRGAEERTATLTIEELPSQRAERVEVLRGLQLITVTEDIAVERGLGVDNGALIVEIQTPLARRTGMREGDVIVTINRREIRSADQAGELIRAAAERGWVEFIISRQGARLVTSFPIRR